MKQWTLYISTIQPGADALSGLPGPLLRFIDKSVSQSSPANAENNVESGVSQTAVKTEGVRITAHQKTGG
jgi:hypothetical protein